MNEVFEYIFPGLMLMFICFIATAVFSDLSRNTNPTQLHGWSAAE